MYNEIILSVRHNPGNEDHHLWLNNGVWWCHYTLHLPDYTKKRVRRSLKTHSLHIARQRRDQSLGSPAFALAA